MRKEMGTRERRYARRADMLPILYIFPAAVALAFATIRWGREIKNLIHVLIKLAVKA